MTDIFEKDRQFLKPGAEATILLPGPPAQGAHERRAAPVRRAVADAEDPFRARQPRPRPPARHVRGRGTRGGHAAGRSRCPPMRSSTPACGRRCSSIAATGTSSHGAWRPAGALGDRVQITQGPDGRRTRRGLRQLPARLRKPHEAAAPGPIAGGSGGQKDPVCGMEVDEKRAAAAGHDSRSTRARPTTSAPTSARNGFDAEPAKIRSRQQVDSCRSRQRKTPS